MKLIKQQFPNIKKVYIHKQLFFVLFLMLFDGVFIINIPEVQAETATYYSTWGAPRCTSTDSPCDAPTSLLQCAGAQTSPGPEANQPNTLDSCTDGSTVGTCRSDESVESITVTETGSDGVFRSGDEVRVDFSIYCWNTTTDRYAVYYSNSATSTSWVRKTSGNPICSTTGNNDLSETFTIASSTGYHAVRVIIEYNQDIASACDNINYTDYDDVAFNVATSNSVTIAASSSSTQPTNVTDPDSDVLLGAFTMVAATSTATITQLILNEEGTVTANGNLTDVRVYWKQEATCQTTIPGDATAFNSTGVSFGASDQATATSTGASISVSTSSVCVYVRADIGSGVSPGDTIGIELTQESDITMSGGYSAGTFPVQLSGTTTVVATSGTIMSTEVDFDWVPSSSNWGEVIWDTTETYGDVKLSVYYTASTACDTIVPDSALTGNSSGLDATSSPLDISGLNTTTYNRICLKAALSTSGSGSPVLNDWTVTWAAAAGNTAPTITSVTTSTDPIPAGQDIYWSVDWNDVDSGDMVKVQICTTNSITTGACTVATWCSSPVFTNRDPEGLCYYTTDTGDIGANDYFAFVCDDDNACSAADTGLFNVAEQSPNAPTNLLLQQMPNPTNIASTSPIFSAVFNDPNTIDIANKYCVEVDTQSDFLGTQMWASDASDCSTGTSMTNCVQGNRCEDVFYNGTALTLNQSVYYWRMWFWDDSNNQSSVSTTGNWTMSNGSGVLPRGVRLQGGRIEGGARMQ